MSAELLNGFSLWVSEFEGAPWADYPGGHLLMDWAAFHSHGLQLAVQLKREVGPDYRVIYCKPVEDPEYRRDGQIEVLGDGVL